MPKKKTIYQPHLSTLRDARAIRTRDAMRQAMLEMLETTPLDQITIRGIADAAGSGYTTFFRHYPTKEALLQELAAEQIRRLVNMALPMLEMSNPRAASVALCHYVNDHRKLWATLLTGGAAGALREEFLKVATELAASRPHTTQFKPSEIVIVLVVSSTIELLAWWLRQKKPMPAEAIAEIHAEMIISPAIKPRESPPKTQRPSKKAKT